MNNEKIHSLMIVSNGSGPFTAEMAMGLVGSNFSPNEPVAAFIVTAMHFSYLMNLIVTSAGASAGPARSVMRDLSALLSHKPHFLA
jgi:hypothetical protein